MKQELTSPHLPVAAYRVFPPKKQQLARLSFFSKVTNHEASNGWVTQALVFKSDALAAVAERDAEIAALKVERAEAWRELAATQDRENTLRRALLCAQANLRWTHFGECRLEDWDGSPPTAAEADAVISAAIKGAIQ